MKKLTLLLCGLLIAGSTFACDGDKKCDKKDCKAKTECCKKGDKKGKECCKKGAKKADQKAEKAS